MTSPACIYFSCESKWHSCNIPTTLPSYYISSLFFHKLLNLFKCVCTRAAQEMFQDHVIQLWILHCCRASSWPPVEPNECVLALLCPLHSSQLPLQSQYQAHLGTVVPQNYTMSSTTKANGINGQAKLKLPSCCSWGFGTRWTLRSLPAQTILCFCGVWYWLCRAMWQMCA